MGGYLHVSEWHVYRVHARRQMLTVSAQNYVQSRTELYLVLPQICAKAMEAESIQSTVDAPHPHLARNCMN